ncbi:MAG: membrane protein insertase YidC [Candidatus Celaenobacter polaris]|nr:membrane protein insertase YidC [Candidatus Celaenobacter polaris]
MDKKTIIALILIFVVFYLSSKYFWKQPAPPQTQQSTTESVDPVKKTPKPASSETKEDTEMDLSLLGIKSEVPLNDAIILENEDIKVILTNRGGNIKQVILKNIKNETREDPVNLFIKEKGMFNTVFYTSSDTINLGNHIFNRDNSYDEFTAAFYIEKDGKRIFEKRYSLDNNHTLNVTIIANDMGFIDAYDIQLDAGIYYDQQGDKRFSTYIDVVSYVDNKIDKINLKKAASGASQYGNITWTALKSKYFMVATIPERTVKLREIFVSADNNAIMENARVEVGRNSIDHSFQLYCGPVDYDRLRSFNIGLEDSMNFGWKLIRPISKLILKLLKFIYSLIPNYGIAIILLSIVIKFVFYPLTHKSFTSAQKMQRVQPHLKELQAKYKGNPQKLQKETMKLYKEHGVSPLGGCLPLLIQFPFLFALYPVLQSTIELRHAGFIFWLKDLSIPDPYYILPILMGITMFFQQKLMSQKQTPNMDEKQLAQLKTQKFMMYGMPIFFVFIFKSLPAGLVLYWFMYNILSVMEQLSIRKKTQARSQEIIVDKKK